MFFNSSFKCRAENIIKAALAKKIKIVTAESCTGGLLSAILTEISGSSSVFERGFVTYSNLAKQQILGVYAKTLQDFGAVSSHVAREMALGALKNSDAQIAISITGIAGPNSDLSHKPVGLVYISIASSDKVLIRKFNFQGSRESVRKSSIKESLNMLENFLKL